MFGDYGHGSLFFFIGCNMVLFHDRLKKIPEMAEAQKARYMFVMMGFFAMYNGLLYNEFFAIPNDWFGTCYDITKPEIRSETFKSPQATYPLGPAGSDCVYPFGTDPTWFLSPNLLTFTNCYKMKIAVIIGVLHMMMGIFVKGLNAVYFNQPMVLVFEVFTGVIILFGLFGWMDYLIFLKWLYPMDPYGYDDAENQKNIATVPSIITIMINNFLAYGVQTADYKDPNTNLT